MAIILYNIAFIPLVDILWHVPGHYANLECKLLGSDGNKCYKCQLLECAEKSGAMIWILSWTQKSWHICHTEDKDEAREEFVSDGLTLCFNQGNCYVGWFVGLELVMQEWLTPMISDWVFRVKQLAAVTGNYPQTAFARMVVSLQAKWQYVYHCPRCGIGYGTSWDCHPGGHPPSAFCWTHSYFHQQQLLLPPWPQHQAGWYSRFGTLQWLQTIVLWHQRGQQRFLWIIQCLAQIFCSCIGIRWRHHGQYCKSMQQLRRQIF